VGRSLVEEEVWMTGRQTMTAWGEPHLLLRQLQVFRTATINGIISVKRRGVSAILLGERVIPSIIMLTNVKKNNISVYIRL
jgi:hypothetical protein